MLRNRQTGFGLIEIMVGLLIGMITSVVVFEVFSLNERQKRATTGSADAQTNSAFGLYVMERDVRMAGFGLAQDFAASCLNTYSYVDTGGGGAGAIAALDTPAPVVITDGGSAVDQVAVLFYSNPASDEFSLPTQTKLRSTMPQTSSELNVSSVAGCVKDSLVLVQQAGNCTWMQITQVQEEAPKIQHNPGGSASADAPKFNPSVPFMNANGWPAYVKDAVVLCGMPPSVPFLRTYQIVNTALQVQDSDAGVAMEVAPNIVGLQAQYGLSAAPDINQVSSWQDATGTWAAGTLTKAAGRRIKAGRLAILAQSSEYEKPATGTSCTTTTNEMIDTWSNWADFSMVKNLPDWQCYRYKAFETVVPLRNVLWTEL